MDRDRRWPRTELWYRAMVDGAGERATDPVAAIRAAYERGETDEFLKPIVIERDGRPVAQVRDGDAIFFFNYRADRMRQIVDAFTEPGFDGFPNAPRPRVNIATMTLYDETFTVPVAFPPFAALAHRGRGRVRARDDHVPHGGDREVRARDLLLQRRLRAALSG